MNVNLQSTQEFWDSNPCGIHAEYEAQKRQRYAMEPWLPPLLKRIAQAHNSLLEVGCGQGIDSTLLCSHMKKGGRYVGIDYSPNSVAIARQNASQLKHLLSMPPEYQFGNAEALAFPDAEFECVYSMGVLHHTADEEGAIEEIRRVLKPGGKAYICLYRKFAPKVAIAKLLRGVQASVDRVFGTDRFFYQMLKKVFGTNVPFFGTMFHECFGVPYMKWYDRNEIANLMSKFATVDISAVGSNLGRLSWSACGHSIAGYFWLVEAEK